MQGFVFPAMRLASLLLMVVQGLAGGKRNKMQNLTLPAKNKKLLPECFANFYLLIRMRVRVQQIHVLFWQMSCQINSGPKHKHTYIPTHALIFTCTYSIMLAVWRLVVKKEGTH